MINLYNYSAGNQGELPNLRYFEYGIQVYDLCADQICKLVESPDMNRGKYRIISPFDHWLIHTHTCMHGLL